MSRPTWNPIYHNQGDAARLGPPPVARGEIIAYIKAALGPHLAQEYSEAIESSVSTGCYDADWVQLGGVKVTQYIAGLQQDWMSKQGDVMPLVRKVLHLRAYGTEKQHALLKQLELEQGEKEGDTHHDPDTNGDPRTN